MKSDYHKAKEAYTGGHAAAKTGNTPAAKIVINAAANKAATKTA